MIGNLEFSNSFLAVAHSLALSGRLRLDQKRYAETQADSEKALEIQKKLLPPNNPHMTLPLANLGNALTKQNRAPEGEPYLRQALEINAKILRSDDWRIVNMESQLGECLMAQRRFDEAEPLLLKGYEKLREKIGADKIFTVRSLLRVVIFYEEINQPEKAASYRQSLPASFTAAS